MIVIKIILFTLGLICVFPFIFINWIEVLFWHRKRERVFISCAELLSLVPTIFGTYVRKAFYWAVCTDVSWESHFLLGCILAHRENIIGRGAVIGHYSFMGRVSIGDNVILGARVSVVSGKYQHGRPEQRRLQMEVVSEGGVLSIGSNTWVGQDAVLLANIGQNCTIGAGSVVYHDVADNTTVIGNPARKVNLK